MPLSPPGYGRSPFTTPLTSSVLLCLLRRGLARRLPRTQRRSLSFRRPPIGPISSRTGGQQILTDATTLHKKGNHSASIHPGKGEGGTLSRFYLFCPSLCLIVSRSHFLPSPPLLVFDCFPACKPAYGQGMSIGPYPVDPRCGPHPAHHG
ncbi:hypothetical protein F4777DRAFT_228090 [Nemania sp. FL0916]|nr:hypothetical protein F4777DRAFT_228090 [Nemania sp. FL0916]